MSLTINAVKRQCFTLTGTLSLTALRAWLVEHIEGVENRPLKTLDDWTFIKYKIQETGYNFEELPPLTQGIVTYKAKTAKDGLYKGECKLPCRHDNKVVSGYIDKSNTYVLHNCDVTHIPSGAEVVSVKTLLGEINNIQDTQFTIDQVSAILPLIIKGLLNPNFLKLLPPDSASTEEFFSNKEKLAATAKIVREIVIPIALKALGVDVKDTKKPDKEYVNYNAKKGDFFKFPTTPQNVTYVVVDAFTWGVKCKKVGSGVLTSLSYKFLTTNKAFFVTS